MNDRMTVRHDEPMVIGIAGAGLIGASWAALFSSHGHTVNVYDPADDVRDRFFERLAQARGDLARLGPIGDGSVTFTASLAEAVAGADLVQECGPEAVDRKCALLAEVLSATRTSPNSGPDFAPHAEPDFVGCPVVSSTSALPHAALTASMTVADAKRIAIGHPFNPPHLVPLVEIYSPSDGVASFLDHFYRSLGREPVRLKRSLPAHGANRLATALWREAVHLVAEGVADVEDVDNLLRHGPGFRWRVMGPFLTYHLGGGDGGLQAYLDHLGDSQEARWQTLGTPTLDSDTRAKLVAGMNRAVRGRSVAELQAERDERFLEMLGHAPKDSAGTGNEIPDLAGDVPGIDAGPARPDESRAIAAMIADLAEFEGKALDQAPSPETVREWLFGTKATLAVLVARENGTPVGYLAWFRGFSPFKGGATLMVENLFVPESHRGRGFGRLLMKAAARTALGLGIRRMELTVRADNGSARTTYTRLGFHATAEEILRIQDADLDKLAAD